MTKRNAAILSSVFLGFLFLFFIVGIMLPDKEFSERENKYLQTRPDFSFSALADGSFTEETETWCAEQFPLRDGWITLNARFELLCGKRETNGVFLGDDGRLIKPFSAPEPSVLRRRSEVVSEFAAASEVPVSFALIPSSAELYAGQLPAGAPNDSQSELIFDAYAAASGTETIDLLSALAPHSEEYIYYRTDHHWTSLGAFYAYRALCESWGLKLPMLGDYAPDTISDSFYGTAYSSSGFTWIEPDRMQSFVPAPTGLSVSDYADGSAKLSTLYHEDRLKTKDKYSYFLGGNSPRIVLHQNEEQPKLLIVRDSYTDCLVPFLLRDFGEIHLIDLRYYTDPVSDYVKENGIDRVLILYSTENFCTDRGLLLLNE